MTSNLSCRYGNRCSNLSSSFTIFWAMVTSLDRVSTYFLLFQFEKCQHGWTLGALCYISSAETNRTGSNPVQTWPLWSLMTSTQIRLYVRPTSGGKVLRSKLVDGRCQIQSPVMLVEVAVRNFLWFFSETRVNSS